VIVGRSAMSRKHNLATVEQEIAHLRDLDMKGLRVRWQSMFRKQAPAHLPRHLLFGILAYQIQADRLGDLDARTVRLLKQIATRGSQSEAATLTETFKQEQEEIRPGTILMREWNGKPHRVMVVDDGFAWNGETYDSLSRIAFMITGTKWNGPRFFGLRDKRPVRTARRA
jgi:hypothetical protein